MGRPESFSMIYCGTDSPEEDSALLCALLTPLLPAPSPQVLNLIWQI